MALDRREDGKLVFGVRGLRFRQNPQSPELVAFVASANELTKFCGVARKSQDLLSNYQRALDQARVDNEVTPFFRLATNCSPTAVVVSLQQTHVGQVRIDSDDSSADQPGAAKLCTLTLTFEDLDALAPDAIVNAALQLLDERLKSSPLGDVAGVEQAEDAASDTSDDAALGASDADDEESDDDTVEIGQSMLLKLRERLVSSPTHPAEMIDALRDMLRPALVIDGQHRLFGAAGVEEDIPMLVCCLVEPDWKEQVFQFIVVNDKAAGIPKPFITSLAGMSLTSGELSELRDRLAQAGIKLWEVDVMQRLGYDSESPFCGLIEFKVAGAEPGLGYQTMKRVGRAWYHPTNSGLYKLMAALYTGPENRKPSKKSLREQWQQSEDWFEMCGMFWRAFKMKFAGTPIWQVHSNFLTAVSIEMLQLTFLKLLDAQSGTFWKSDEADAAVRRTQILARLQELIGEFVEKFDRKYFEKEWKRKSLNHKDGKRDLADLFRRINEDESTTNHVIYTGKANV